MKWYKVLTFFVAMSMCVVNGIIWTKLFSNLAVITLMIIIFGIFIGLAWKAADNYIEDYISKKKYENDRHTSEN